VTLAGLGLVALGIGAWAAFTSLPRLQDAVAYVSAARCDASSRRFDNCYIAKDGTIVSIGDRVVYNVADPSSDVCGDGIQFADGSKETFDLTCDAPDFQAGKHVIGRFWKGQLIQVTGDDGTVSTNADQWAVIFGSALGLALILLGVGSIALAWIVRPRARPSSRSA
jgi:hypothetical protein